MTPWTLFCWCLAIGTGLPVIAGGIALAGSLLHDARHEWRTLRAAVRAEKEKTR